MANTAAPPWRRYWGNNRHWVNDSRRRAASSTPTTYRTSSPYRRSTSRGFRATVTLRLPFRDDAASINDAYLRCLHPLAFVSPWPSSVAKETGAQEEEGTQRKRKNVEEREAEREREREWEREKKREREGTGRVKKYGVKRIMFMRLGPIRG